MSGTAATRMDSREAARTARPLCPAQWGHTTGYIAVRDPFTGEVHEIPYRDATPVWRDDIRYQRGNRR